MTLAPHEIVAGVMLVSLVLYVLLAGADFGGGVWDLLSAGPRKEAQKKLVEGAIAPVWEANHVWMILLVVLLFTAFPLGYAVITTALHVPLTLMLLGIVLRGSAFTFRHYAGEDAVMKRRWGRIFAIASTVTPLFLGICMAALSDGEIRVKDEVVTTGFFRPWLGPFPFVTGLFTLALFALLAAVYLVVEAKEEALKQDFRQRALGSAIAVALLALVAAFAAGRTAEQFSAAFRQSSWFWPLQLLTGGSACTAFFALITKRDQLAKAAVISQVALIVIGFGAAQYPYLVTPDVTFESAMAPVLTQKLLLAALAAGSLLLFPSLIWLFRIFKSTREEPR